MKSLYKLAGCLFIISSILSCNSTHSTIERNKKKTVDLFEVLLIKNGNVFTVSSTHTNFSFVWSYENDSVKFYKLLEGKVQRSDQFNASNNWLLNVPLKTNMAFAECYELDGDYIKYEIVQNEKKITNVLPVNLECFLKAPKEKEFYKRLADDIIRFEAKW